METRRNSGKRWEPNILTKAQKQDHTEDLNAAASSYSIPHTKQGPVCDEDSADREHVPGQWVSSLSPHSHVACLQASSGLI